MKKTKSKKERIIEEWNKTKIVHPSYREIAKIVKVSHSYVHEVLSKMK